MAAKLFTAIGFRVDIEEVMHPDGRVLVFSIPSRPKGTAYHHKGAYLMRSGEELVPMSEDQLRKIFAEGQPSWLDASALSNVSAQDIVQLLDTQSFFDLLNHPIQAIKKRHCAFNGRTLNSSDRNGVCNFKFSGITLS